MLIMRIKGLNERKTCISSYTQENVQPVLNTSGFGFNFDW